MTKEIKLTTVDIKSLSREDLEEAYRNLLKISLMKSELIKTMELKSIAQQAKNE